MSNSTPNSPTEGLRELTVNEKKHITSFVTNCNDEVLFWSVVQKVEEKRMKSSSSFGTYINSGSKEFEPTEVRTPTNNTPTSPTNNTLGKSHSRKASVRSLRGESIIVVGKHRIYAFKPGGKVSLKNK